MAVINPDQKWIYLFEPHTASRATYKLLTTEGGGSNIGHHHIGVDEMTNWRREHISHKQLRDYQIIATVRNPFDVLVTRWKVSPGKDKPFEEWAWENRDHITVRDPLRGLWREASIWCYYEDLEADLRWVFGRHIDDPHNEPFRLPYNQAHKTGGKQPWNTYYESESGRRVMKYLCDRRYGHFLRQFGYNIYEDGNDPTAIADHAQRWVCEIDKEVRKLRTQQIKIVQGY